MKKIIVTVLLCFVLVSASLAQGSGIVFDPTNFLVALDTLYSTYDQIMNTLQQIEYTYDQIQHYTKEAQQWKLDEIQWDGDWDFRNEIRDVTSSVNKQITNIRMVNHYMTNYPIRMGNQSYTMKDLMGRGEEGKDIVDAVKNTGSWIMTDQMKKAAAGFEGKLSSREKAAIWNRYGLSPANYYFLEAKNKEINSLIEKVTALGMEERIKENLQETESRVAPIMAKAFEDDITLKELMQNEMFLLRELIRQIGGFEAVMGESASLAAQVTSREKAEEDAKAEEREKMRTERLNNNDPGLIF